MEEGEEEQLFVSFGDLDMEESKNKERRSAALAAPTLTEEGRLRVLTDQVSHS